MFFSRRKTEPLRKRRRGRNLASTRKLSLRAPEPLEHRLMMHGDAMPLGAMPDDTGEYMLGDVYVTVVLMESNTQISAKNNNSENWTAASISAVKQNVREGLQWWVDTLATKTTKPLLNFNIDFKYADAPVSTSYEPIARKSDDFGDWVYDFLDVVGFNTRGNFHEDLRAFNHAQRIANHSDWAFTIFVVNDEKDTDDQFAAGGEFSKAFAFAGGQAIVSPASRPSSTYSHETGHQFWAMDEYQPAGSYDLRRGYYDTQNLNAWNNPSPGFHQTPSIMSNKDSLDTAFATHTSAASTLEMIGWKDSDGDGVFDVLDVPLELNGSGYYDEVTGQYHFKGTSWVQTLPNKNRYSVNNEGLNNDITINKVSRAEYRIDDGVWQTAALFGTAEATLDLTFPVSNGASQIEIRTVDDRTGISSQVFHGPLDRPASILLPGLNGVVWNDQNHDGLIGANEPGLPSTTVQLVDQAGQPLVLRKSIEPDDYASKTPLNSIAPGVTLAAFGNGLSNNVVAAFSVTSASTGSKLFASESTLCGEYCTDWTSDTRQLRIDFEFPVTTLSLDALGTSVAGYGRLEIYDNSNRLLGRYTTQQLASGQVEQMTLSRPTAEIKYAIAHGHAGTAIRFDNLQHGAHTTAVTDENGAYSIANLPAGTYNVRAITGPGRTATAPANATQVITIGEGDLRGGVDFGMSLEPSPWQNAVNRYDVNGDGQVAPLDVLAVINSLNRGGTRALSAADTTPPYVDVNGDFQLAPIDALQIINLLNRGGSGGESEAQIVPLQFVSSRSNSTNAAEGESSVESTAAPASQNTQAFDALFESLGNADNRDRTRQTDREESNCTSHDDEQVVAQLRDDSLFAEWYSD